jgi:hypothetical protein
VLLAAALDADGERQALLAARRHARGGARGLVALEGDFEPAALERGFIAQHEIKNRIRACERVALEIHIDAEP